MASHEPRRTCVACRTTTAKSQLLRFTVASDRDGVVVRFDPRKRAAGRGAYLCADQHCIDLVATNGRPLHRTLRSDGAEVTPALAAARTHLADAATHTKEQLT